MLVPKERVRRANFNKLRDASNNILSDSHIIEIRDWFPHPMDHKRLKPVLEQCTIVKELGQDHALTWFERGDVTLDPSSPSYKHIMESWPTDDGKKLQDGDKNMCVSDRDRGRMIWIGACVGSMYGDESKPMAANWQSFATSQSRREIVQEDEEMEYEVFDNDVDMDEDDRAQKMAYDEMNEKQKASEEALNKELKQMPGYEKVKVDDDPTEFPERPSCFPLMSSRMRVSFGLWWYDENDESVEKALETLGEEDYSYKDIFDTAKARPSRIMLVIKDDLLPGLIQPGKGFTHSEFTYAVAYMHFMQASEASALLLITIFGVTEVFWDYGEDKLAFHILPMLNLGGAKLEPLQRGEHTDPWRLVSWLCCRTREPGRIEPERQPGSQPSTQTKQPPSPTRKVQTPERLPGQLPSTPMTGGTHARAQQSSSFHPTTPTDSRSGPTAPPTPALTGERASTTSNMPYRGGSGGQGSKGSPKPRGSRKP